MNQLLRVALVLAALTAGGTVAFMLIEGWSLLDSLYMAVITLTTVGYGETHPLSPAGRWFTIFYLVVGLGLFMHSVVSLGEVVVRAQLGQWIGRTRLAKAIKQMQNHFIVCGYGRFGRSLSEQLAARGMPFVVIEADPTAADGCLEKGWPIVVGDATDDSTLVEAGIDRARGIACTLPSDAANLYVVLSARLLRDDLQILSRATTEKDGEKLRRAGANRVISPYATGATKMAQLMANPRVEDLIEVVSTPGKELELAEVEVGANARYVGQPLSRSGLSGRGVMVVAIRRAAGDLLVPPAASDEIHVGDVLFAFGKADAIRALLRGHD
ncbi:MAG: potassium channel protein [Planctomycetes bacterium]|nr:potassium channel protein [Planctomycetota bacterium]